MEIGEERLLVEIDFGVIVAVIAIQINVGCVLLHFCIFVPKEILPLCCSPQSQLDFILVASHITVCCNRHALFRNLFAQGTALRRLTRRSSLMLIFALSNKSNKIAISLIGWVCSRFA